MIGYKYYVEVGIDINPRRGNCDTGPLVRREMNEIGADVRIVRRVRRRTVRSYQWQLFAVFRDKESAMLFKLREGGGRVKKFRWYEF